MTVEVLPRHSCRCQVWSSADLEESASQRTAELTDNEREAVVARHVRDETLAQTAARRGATRQAQGNLERKALAKLRTALEPVKAELLDAVA